MAKSIKVNQKKRGRPATGRDPVSAVRFPAEVTAQIDAWAANQESHPSRSEAIRRLVELGLTVKAAQRGSTKQKLRAQEMAAGAIDKLTDPAASPPDKVQRKRRLLKGPSEFVESRVDSRSHNGRKR
jgi:Arc/MetJ-type ribon-helix-helix transcriptional regulator